MTNAIYATLLVATVFFMKRKGHGWAESIIAGIMSPVAYIFLFTILLAPTAHVLGMLRVPEEVVSTRSVGYAISAFIVVGWCVAGYLLTRKKHTRSETDSENESLPERRDTEQKQPA